MEGTPSTLLANWSNFYVTMGSSAAALTGLMFVVITLVNRGERSQGSSDGIATFSTPTVLHFCAALFFSAVLNAPWHLLLDPAFIIGLTALYGVVYVLRVMRRTKRLTGYTPDTEDWMWYTIVPLVAYSIILAGAVILPIASVRALFVLAGGVVLLIFLGIRNSWDVVTFIAMGGPDASQPKE